MSVDTYSFAAFLTRFWLWKASVEQMKARGEKNGGVLMLEIKAEKTQKPLEFQ